MTSESDVLDLASHLVRRLDLRGWPAYRVDPRTAKFERHGASGRCSHALVALYDAGIYAARPEWVQASLSGVAFALSNVQSDPLISLHLRHHVTGHMGDAMLLWAACAVGGGALVDDTVHSLARRIRGWIRDSGGVRPEGARPSTVDADYLPGVALLALAQYSLVSRTTMDIDWCRIRAWYERRFRSVRGWGLACGHCKLWSMVAALTGDPTHLEFSFELADWMVSQQLRSDGSFPTDLDPSGPGFHTAAFAEGVALAWTWAGDAGEIERADKYERSWKAAMVLMDRLMVRKCDTYWMPDPVLAVGGVRRDLTSFDLRVDYVSHTLNAVIAGLRASSGGVPKNSAVAEGSGYL